MLVHFKINGQGFKIMVVEQSEYFKCHSFEWHLHVDSLTDKDHILLWLTWSEMRPMCGVTNCLCGTKLPVAVTGQRACALHKTLWLVSGSCQQNWSLIPLNVECSHEWFMAVRDVPTVNYKCITYFVLQTAYAHSANANSKLLTFQVSSNCRLLCSLTSSCHGECFTVHCFLAESLKSVLLVELQFDRTILLIINCTYYTIAQIPQEKV